MGVLKPVPHLGSILFDNPLPLSGARPNPLLRHDLKRYGIATERGTEDLVRSELNQYAKRYGCLIPAVLGVCAIMYMCGIPSYPGLLCLAPLAIVVFFGGIVFSILANLYYVLVAIQSAGHRISSPDWDTVRVTLLSSEDIVEAKYTVGLVRVWKVAVIETGIRMSIAVILLAVMAFVCLWARNLFSALLYFAAFLVPIVIIILEPSWRTQALTALGVAIAARFTSTTFAILAGFGAVLTLLISLVAILLGFGKAINRLAYDRPLPVEQSMLLQIAISLIGLALVYAFYALIKYISLNRASALVAHAE